MNNRYIYPAHLPAHTVCTQLYTVGMYASTWNMHMKRVRTEALLERIEGSAHMCSMCCSSNKCSCISQSSGPPVGTGVGERMKYERGMCAYNVCNMPVVSHWSSRNCNC